MKRAALVLLACVALIGVPRHLLAQEASPQPTPADWMIYDDPAMHFHAPAGWAPVGQRQIPLAKLGEDPVVVAAWINPDRNHPYRLIIQQEYFQGEVNAFISQYEGQLRDNFDTPLFKNKKNITLRNGMPAIYEEMTQGSGFSVSKIYLEVWADGARGVAMILSGPMNDLDETKARQYFSDASAVRYPVNRGDL